ncbi:hypothetical protein ACFXPZ_13415 [Streptomyces sp. NPDC059101]|uniref:hypothetical protein n=1 Tax=Streptomyces sp. NPDC059101 TaxID=3346728 RepID=UPI0036A368D4
MGGRAALRAGGHPAVRGVVVLAPWCPPEEPVAHLRGKRLALLHDARDRTTDYRGSREFSERARRAGADAQLLTMPRGRHTMLRGAGQWYRTAARLTRAMLAGSGSGSVPGLVPGPGPGPGADPGADRGADRGA